jgi:hypothetical protein
MTFAWGTGDLFCTPLDVDHEHRNTTDTPTRLLQVRNAAVEHALRAIQGPLDVEVRSRFPTLVEPDYSMVDPADLQPPD